MRSLSGIRIVVVLPCPGMLSTVTLPPSALMFETTTSMPTPRPEYSVTWSFVEKPGAKMKL